MAATETRERFGTAIGICSSRLTNGSEVHAVRIMQDERIMIEWDCVTGKDALGLARGLADLLKAHTNESVKFD